jgi:hypothetical protein
MGSSICIASVLPKLLQRVSVNEYGAPCEGRIRRSVGGAVYYRRPAPWLVSLSTAGKNQGRKH